MYRYQWYQSLYENTQKIHEDALKLVDELGLKEIAYKVGLYPGSSSCPGPLPNYVMNAINKANEIPVLPVRKVEDELREVVKDIYGDRYDVAVANTCEAGLRIVYETLFTPPYLRKGDAYRARYIAPYGEDFEFVNSYGRPFPPKYKGLIGDRSVSSGELSVEAKSLNNLDAIYVRLDGVMYEPHGIKYNPVPLMTKMNHKKSFETIKKVADRHCSELVGFSVVGYETPGYGGNEKDENGVPLIMKMIGELALDYDVPFIVDGAGSAPVFWPSLEKIGCNIMLWSMDKAVRAPISGLLIGEEEIMVPIRKAMGLGGSRFGEISSHSKALFALSDPGRDSVVGLTSLMKVLRDQPNKVTDPIDQMHSIIVEEFSKIELPQRLISKMLFTKSYAYGGTEINYERTWEDNNFGIPIFSLEDLYANTNPIMSALDIIGIFPATIYSGNMFITPGLGTLDQNGDLMEEPTRLAVKALVRVIEIVCRYCGLLN